MKFKRLRIENFKCIEDSTEFNIDQITCLVGKNEAGKTALLEALYKLKPVEENMSDFDEEDYPRRHLATYRQRQEREPANVLTTIWELDDADVSAIKEILGSNALASQEVIIKKGYDNITRWEVSLNEDEIVERLLGDTKLNAAEKAPLAKARSIRDLMETLEGLSSPTKKQSSLLQRLSSSFPKREGGEPVLNVLDKRLPHFVYFSTYQQLPGRVALEDLKQRKAKNKLNFEDKVFLSLLEMTSTGLEEIEGIDQLEKLIMELESVEAALTDEIKRYWSQNKHLEVRFRYDQAKPSDPPPLNEGFVFNTRIYNTRHRATVTFEQRSHGFIWFFSFLVWFSQVKKEYGDNLILLLDEPGLPLHGRAQQDLIRYINERLRPYHQVIYTAHSPFLIDVENIFSIRAVEDVLKVTDREGERTEEILGTKVGEQILSRDSETLFPLQGVLGFDMAQTLFVGPYVVVVEGPTEAALFHWFSRQLDKLGREGLDIRWAVCPSEGASKVSSFVTLFHGRGLQIAALLDYHDGQKGLVERLEESGLLERGHLLKTASYVEQGEADIEDLIGRDMYTHLVNAALSLRNRLKLPIEKPYGAEQRVVKEVEAHFRLLPPGFPEFDHYMPVNYLMGLSQHEIDSLPGIEGALGRFEKLFKDLNRLIK